MSGKYNYIRKSARYGGKKYEATGKTEAEALKKLHEKLAAAKRGEETAGGSMTVDAWFNEWFEVYKKPAGLTQRSLEIYETDYRLYIRPAIGSMKLRDVRDIHLQKILNAQAHYSRSHVKHLLSVMQQIFKRARQSRLILYDPAETLVMPAAKAGQRRSITDEERAAILAVAEYHRNGLLILTLLYTGIRPGEAAALKWRDVDFDKNEIHVHSAMEAGTTRIKTPKTSAGVRDIPLRPVLRERLLPVRGEPNEYVFSIRGKPTDNKTLWNRWRSFYKELDIYLGAEVKDGKIVKHAVAQDLTLYCLRHTFCTDCQRAGIPINVAKELMGHADISMTANIYTHRDNATLHENFALLDNL